MIYFHLVIIGKNCSTHLGLPKSQIIIVHTKKKQQNVFLQNFTFASRVNKNFRNVTLQSNIKNQTLSHNFVKYKCTFWKDVFC